MHFRDLFVCALLASSLYGCDEAEETGQLEDEELIASSAFRGVWQQEGYARLLSIDDDQLQFYDLTEVSCVPSESIELAALLDEYERLSGDEQQFQWYERGAFTRYAFRKEDELPKRCNKQASDPVATFDALYHLFAENYGFFNERDIDWTAASTLGDELTSNSTDEELMSVFQEMLTPFNDGHVYVFDPVGGSGFLGGTLGDLWSTWAEQYEGNPVSENPINPRGTFTEEMQKYVLEIVLQGKGKSGPYDMLHWGWLSDGVGYLDVHAMNTYETEASVEEANVIINDAMQELMNDLKSAEAIVIDARFNEGGYDTIGYAIASWFTTESAVLSQKRL